MKRIFIKLFCLVILICSCTENDKEYILTDCDVIQIGPEGGLECVHVNSNFEWTVLNSPEWCEIEQSDKSWLGIRVSPNIAENQRYGTITVGKENLYTLFSIAQDGMSQGDYEKEDFHVMSFNDFVVSSVDSQNEYRIKADKLFLSDAMLKNLRIGGMMENHISDSGTAVWHNEYRINPLTVGAYYGNGCVSEIWEDNSYTNLEKLSGEMIESGVGQNVRFHYSSPISFNSLKHLNLLGRGNIFKGLDEIIGLPYSIAPTEIKTGLLFSFSQELFTILMDYPEKLTDALIDKAIADKLSYVNSVIYGKMSIMIVISDLERNELISLINKVMSKKTLTDTEEDKLKNTEFYLVRFDGKKNADAISGGLEIIGDFVNVENDEIVPLSFTVNSYVDNAVGSVYFNVNQ